MLWLARWLRKLKLPWDCDWNRELEYIAKEAEEAWVDENGSIA